MHSVWKNKADVWELPSSGHYATCSNCHYSLSNNPEEGDSSLLRGGILKSHETDMCFNTSGVRPTIVIYI